MPRRPLLLLLLSFAALAGPARAQELVYLADPAAAVLDEIRSDCAGLSGIVAVETGFARAEDLDGDGRSDPVIDYAAAVCSESASLFCGSGGCAMGFFLARDEGYRRLFSGTIRGYVAEPGGVLALDLHGSACGLVGYEACRKRFDVTSGEMVLIEELTGDAAMAADDRAVSPEPGADLSAGGNGKGKDDAPRP